MDALRKPFFVVALLLLLLVVSTEIGGGLAVSGSYAGNICNKLPNDDDIRKECDPDEANGLKEDVPGLAISYLALVDGVLLFTVGLMGASLLLPDSIHGRIQGIITLIFAILLILASIALIFVALGKLLLMVGLFLSVPFGTIAYFAAFASFPRGAAAAVLSGIMLLKIGFVACLLLAQQRFLQNKGLVLLILTALLSNIIVSFLHGLVPGFLVSITDALAAIILGIIAVIWLIVLLIGSIPAIIKSIV
ncbi:MAG: hypothetical protein H6650_13350 [Ardenticatenales bacterium]|nr:hypothetical protein [Ardenticatenales bacterium]